jgi:hypothetical protein
VNRDRVVHVRVTPVEAAAIAQLAGKGGVSGWIRRLIHDALTRPHVTVRDTTEEAV